MTGVGDSPRQLADWMKRVNKDIIALQRRRTVSQLQLEEAAAAAMVNAIPDRLSIDGAYISDVNGIYESGFYRVTTGSTNVPVAAPGVLLHERYTSTGQRQRIVYLTGSAAGQVWERTSAGGTWTEWDRSYLTQAEQATLWAAKDHSHTWAQITGKPSTFPPSGHTHAASDITSGTFASARYGARTIPFSAIEAHDYSNLVSGSDFENEATIPWSIDAAPNYTIETSTDFSHSGSKRLRITPPGTSNVTCVNWFDVMEGDRLYISLWVRRDGAFDGGGNSKLRIIDQNSSIKGQLTYSLSNMPNASEWYQRTMVWTCPTGVNTVSFTLMTDHTAGNLYIDDIEIRRQIPAGGIRENAVTMTEIDPSAYSTSSAASASAGKLVAKDSSGRFGILDPTTATHPATKGYVDAQVSSLTSTINNSIPDWILRATDNGMKEAYNRLITYGHSFLAEQGLTSASDYYARKVASWLALSYPSQTNSNNLKRAVGGSLVDEAAWRMFSDTSVGWKEGERALVLIQALINTARLYGSDAVTRTGATQSLRAMVAMASCDSFIGARDTSFFSYAADSGWTFGDDSDFHGGSYRSTSRADAYVDFTMPEDDCFLYTVGRKEGLSAAVTTITRTDSGGTIYTFNNQNQAQAGISRNYVPVAIKINAPKGTRIRVTATSGTTTIVGLGVPSKRPNTVVLMKEPYLADYSASTSFPNGSDAAIDYFNASINTIDNEFPNVIVADPADGGWTKAAAAGMVQTDKVHPNVAGNNALYAAVLAACRSRILQRITAGVF